MGRNCHVRPRTGTPSIWTRSLLTAAAPPNPPPENDPTAVLPLGDPRPGTGNGSLSTDPRTADAGDDAIAVPDRQDRDKEPSDESRESHPATASDLSATAEAERHVTVASDPVDAGDPVDAAWTVADGELPAAVSASTSTITGLDPQGEDSPTVEDGVTAPDTPVEAAAQPRTHKPSGEDEVAADDQSEGRPGKTGVADVEPVVGDEVTGRPPGSDRSPSNAAGPGSDRAPDTPSDAPAAPDLLGGRYRLDGRIAVGGMGEICRGHDTLLDRPVAVKLLRDALVEDDNARRRFQREAQAAAALVHPHVAVVFDHGRDGDRWYIVMELVEGESLAQRLHRTGTMPCSDALLLAERVARALAAAHRRGIVHRDVKPGNVLLGREGQVKVTDFGIARSLGQTRLTRTGMVLGTIAYLAPEQARGLPVGPPADVYALGAMLFEILTGTRLYEGGSDMAVIVQHLSAPPPDVRTRSPELPAPVAELVTSMLAKDPAERPDASEAARRMRRLASDPAGPGPEPERVRQDRARPSSQRRLPAADHQRQPVPVRDGHDPRPDRRPVRDQGDRPASRRPPPAPVAARPRPSGARPRRRRNQAYRVPAFLAGSAAVVAVGYALAALLIHLGVGAWLGVESTVDPALAPLEVTWSGAFVQIMEDADLPEPIPRQGLGVAVAGAGLFLAALATSAASALSGRNTLWQRIGVGVLGVLTVFSGFLWVALLLAPAALWLLIASVARTVHDRDTR